jgi:ABC-2 type transport system ATP-binding protein
MLKVRDLRKDYNGFQALKGISFEVDAGEIFGLVGENGAGKSTTLKILAGLIEPSGGTVEYFGMNFFEYMEEIKKRIGYLPEFDALYENMLPIEYLTFFASLYGIDKSEAEKRGERLLDMLKLPNREIRTFSKGMKRKLSIARTLIHDPDVLIYDEPTSGLDPTTSLFIANLLKELKEEGKAIIFSAHNMYYVETVCDKIAIMKGGKILYCGDIDYLRDTMKKYILVYQENGEEKKIVTENADDVNEIIKDVVKGGGKILRVETEVPRLEDIYFKLLNQK